MDLCKAIHKAVLDGDSFRIIGLLSKEPAYCDVRNQFGWTPLHTAAYALQGKAAQILLRAGADLQAKDSQGNSPLQLALQVDPNSPVVSILSGEPESVGRPEQSGSLQTPWWKQFVYRLLGFS